MVGSAVYDWMYRHWAPWDSVGVRPDLLEFLDRRQITPQRFPRAIDLGCGTGANVVHLASIGFESWGVDFSQAAIDKARQRADSAGVEAHFVVGDLTGRSIEGVAGPFDLIVDFGTLDDLRGESRLAMASLATSLAGPGARFLEYCFYGDRRDLPWISFSGTSKLSHVAPGELESLFGEHWEVEPFATYPRIAVFELTRR